MRPRALRGRSVSGAPRCHESQRDQLIHGRSPIGYALIWGVNCLRRLVLVRAKERELSGADRTIVNSDVRGDGPVLGRYLPPTLDQTSPRNEAARPGRNIDNDTVTDRLNSHRRRQALVAGVGPAAKEPIVAAWTNSKHGGMNAPGYRRSALSRWVLCEGVPSDGRDPAAVQAVAVTAATVV